MTMATTFMEMFSQVSQVNDSLFISSCYALKSERLKQLGINFIVNCTLEVPIIRDPQIETVQIHVDDTPFTNLKIYFDRIADRIAETIARGGKVLVHCVAGVSRSASMVLAYLMKHQRMTLKEAFLLLKQKRPIVRPNVGFWRQLIQYETKLYGTATVRMVDSAFGQIPDVYKDESRNLVWPMVPNAFPSTTMSHSASMPVLNVSSLTPSSNAGAAKDSKLTLPTPSGVLSNGTRPYDSGVKESQNSTTPSLPPAVAGPSARYRPTNPTNVGRSNQLYATPPVLNIRNSQVPNSYAPSVSPGLSIIGRSQTAQNGLLRTAASNSRYSSTFARLGFM